jgi:membrane protein YdbS with pleckstrin-like domain
MAKSRKPALKRPTTRKPAKKSFDRRGLLRQLLIIFLLSFFISTALIVYLFGMTSDFFSRLFWCILVVFSFISVMVLGIIPVINYYGNKWLK